MAAHHNQRYWVGFDLGGTKMLAKVFDSKYRTVGRERTKTKGYEGAEAGLERITTTIQKALHDADIKSTQVEGIGVGCPGPLDLKRGKIRMAPNLGWTNVPVKKHLEAAFSCPSVILNDVDAGIYGEYRFGAAQSAQTVVGVFPGTGIGGGCVYEGNILQSKSGSCMEIGHVQVVPEGPLCGCGRRGCLEAIASRLVIASRSAAAAYRGPGTSPVVDRWYGRRPNPAVVHLPNRSKLVTPPSKTLFAKRPETSAEPSPESYICWALT